MAEDNDKKQPLHDDGKPIPAADFLGLAKDADDSGDFLLSMYLYLAAFQKSTKGGSGPNEDAITGLKQAWALACSHKERSLAEYIFELMEPYLSHDEIATCADQLHELAIDSLAEIGLSREELEGMAEAISEELVSVEGGEGVEGLLDNLFSMLPSATVVSNVPTTLTEDTDAQKGRSSILDPVDGSLRDAMAFDPESFDYAKLAGYDKTIAIMRELGIGVGADASHQKLLEMLNYRHGLTSAPAMDTLMFRSDVREDANRFMMATVGELGLPAIHMRMEEGYQNSPILCISTYRIDAPTPTALKDAFANGGVLILENLDLWESPVVDPGEDGNPLFLMQMTRGAREAIGLVRSAVDDPNVLVIATASMQGSIDEFFLELLEPLTFIDISLPDETDRLDIWMEISKNHPSFRQMNKKELVRYSANMARFDIYMAAREAVEEAYKAGLAYKRYIPITRDNLFDKLACYHPLESDEYSGLEDEVVRDFQDDLDHIDDLLDGK